MREVKNDQGQFEEGDMVFECEGEEMFVCVCACACVRATAHISVITAAHATAVSHPWAIMALQRLNAGLGAAGELCLTI